jgi:beta-barrel assembly-enhancing protease
MFFAEYSDGKSAKIHQVKVVFKPTELTIEGFDFDLFWNYDELNKVEKTKTNFSVFKGEQFPFESLLFDDVKAFEYLQNIAPNNAVFNESHLKFEKVGTKGYLLGFLGITVVLALFHFIIIPFSIDTIAKNFPKDMEAKLGENYMAIAEQYGFVDEKKTALIKTFAQEINFDTDYDLDFYVVESDMVNAFALPGGKIIVFSALIDSMQNYHQLISLMGHETGHVELRHSLQSIFREQSYQILFSALSGGNNEIIETYIGVASTLNSLHDSRSHEKQADNYALKVLLLNNSDPAGVVQLFQILASGGGDSYIPDILSTHPSAKNRINELQLQIDTISNNTVVQQPILSNS